MNLRAKAETSRSRLGLCPVLTFFSLEVRNISQGQDDFKYTIEMADGHLQSLLQESQEETVHPCTFVVSYQERPPLWSASSRDLTGLGEQLQVDPALFQDRKIHHTRASSSVWNYDKVSRFFFSTLCGLVAVEGLQCSHSSFEASLWCSAKRFSICVGPLCIGSIFFYLFSAHCPVNKPTNFFPKSL